MSIRAINKKKLHSIACTALVIAPYYLLLFTFWGNPYHGPGPWSAMALDAFIVLGAYASIELIRQGKSSAQRVPAVLVGIPLFLLVVFRLYWAISHYYWPWVST